LDQALSPRLMFPLPDFWSLVINLPLSSPSPLSLSQPCWPRFPESPSHFFWSSSSLFSPNSSIFAGNSPDPSAPGISSRLLLFPPESPFRMSPRTIFFFYFQSPPRFAPPKLHSNFGRCLPSETLLGVRPQVLSQPYPPPLREPSS